MSRLTSEKKSRGISPGVLWEPGMFNQPIDAQITTTTIYVPVLIPCGDLSPDLDLGHLLIPDFKSRARSASVREFYTLRLL